MTARVEGSNAAILNAVRAHASLNYQQRVPQATQNNLSHVMSQINDGGIMWNEFLNVLMNTIAVSFFNEWNFTNKLKPLKRGALQHGAMAQELGTNLLHANAYDPNATNVFHGQKPDVEMNLHVINRRDVYDMEVNEELLKEAVYTEGQLSAWLNALFALPAKSDEQDEYLIMRDLLVKYWEAGDFANVQVPDIVNASDPEAAGKEITKQIRTWYMLAKDFYRKDLNPLRMDACANELILLSTPQFFATLDVEVLANAYHMEKAEFMADRVIILDQIAIDGFQALLVDRDIYQCYDSKYKTANIYNPRADSWVYYLHHWGIYSMSRQNNAILFSTAPDTIPAIRTSKPVSVDVQVKEPACLVQFAKIPLLPNVTYEDGHVDHRAYIIINGIEITSDNGTEVVPMNDTYVDRLNVLHVGNELDWIAEPNVSSAKLYLTAVSDDDANVKSEVVELTPMG